MSSCMCCKRPWLLIDKACKRHLVVSTLHGVRSENYGATQASRTSFYVRKPCRELEGMDTRIRTVSDSNRNRRKSLESTGRYYLHVAGIEARRVYNIFEIDEGDIEKIDVLKTKFKEYCEPRKNLT